MPVASELIDPGSTVIFSFPGKETLRIRSGANEIKWAYRLNTRVTPTHGGEVVQVLSCYVDAIQISGNTTSNDDMETIYYWFRDYMTRAGLHNRNEQAVLFEYPTRGWSLWLQPTKIPDFQFRLELVATEWKIIAEVVSDNDLNTLSAHTMGQFTNALLDESMQAVGFNPKSPILDPTVPPNQYASTIQNLGDNFQRLMGAWATNDFPDYAYDAAKSPVENGFTKSSRDYWMQLFGTDFITGKTGTTPGGSGTYTGPTNPSSESAVVADIYYTFEAAGVPGRLGVAIAHIESGWNPDSRQDPTGACRACGIGLFQTNGDGSGRDSSTEVKKAGENPHDKVTKYYPSGQQIQAAAAWFHAFGRNDGFSLSDKNDDQRLASWGLAAQGASDPAYKAKILSELKVADQAIKKYVTSGSDLRGLVVHYANVGIANNNVIGYSFGGARPMNGHKGKGNFPDTDCSGFVELCFYWGCDGKGQYDPMGPGNNYTAAFSGGMISSSNGRTINKTQAKAGDLCVFGDHHVALFIEDWHGDATKLASHGSDSGPASIAFGDEVAAQLSYGSPQPTIRSFL